MRYYDFRKLMGIHSNSKDILLGGLSNIKRDKQNVIHKIEELERELAGLDNYGRAIRIKLDLLIK